MKKNYEFLYFIQGYVYAGVQASSKCYCGNEYDRYGPANDCNMPCGGDKATKCGGKVSNQVYKVSKLSYV